MKALFVHDHFFVRNACGEHYSAGTFPWYHWEKYQKHFNELTVAGRDGGLVEDTRGLVKSSREGVRFVLVHKISTASGIMKFKKVRGSLAHLIRKSHVVIVRLPSENGLIAASLARKMNKPYVVEVVGCAWGGLWNHGRITGKMYAPLLYCRMRNAVKKAPNVLYVTRQFLQSRYPAGINARVESVSNVYVTNFDEKVLNNRIMSIRQNRFSAGVVRLGLIGNYRTRYKGIHIAIKAMSILKNKYRVKNLRLNILGKGNPEEYKDLIDKNNVEDVISFDGTLPSGKPVMEWLDNLDLYLHPSLQEGLPRAIIEAMSRGNLVVGTETGGIPELLPRNMLVKPGKPSPLAQKIREVIHMPQEEKISIAKTNFAMAQKYHIDSLNTKRELFFSGVMDSPYSTTNYP